MEYILPDEYFPTFPAWNYLGPSGPGFDNFSTDDGDPIATYTCRLLYPPTNFWFKFCIDLGAIAIGEKFHCYLTKDSEAKEVYVQLDFTNAGQVYRIIKFTFSYQKHSWKSWKMNAATTNGDYSQASYLYSPPFSEEVEREGAPQPKMYWFLKMSGALGWIKTPDIPPFLDLSMIKIPIAETSLF